MQLNGFYFWELGAVASNILSRFGVVWILPLTWVVCCYSMFKICYVLIVLVCQHAPQHVMTKFHHLFSYVSEESVARPSSYEHYDTWPWLLLNTWGEFLYRPWLSLMRSHLWLPRRLIARWWLALTWYVLRGCPIFPVYVHILQIIAAASRTGQRMESPDACWVTVSFFSSFFVSQKWWICSPNILGLGESVARLSHIRKIRCFGCTVVLFVLPWHGDIKVFTWPEGKEHTKARQLFYCSVCFGYLCFCKRGDDRHWNCLLVFLFWVSFFECV
jgi:hypothetical protein